MALTYEDIVGVLEGRGWEAKIVPASKIPIALIDVDPKGILKCVDGRGSDNKKMAGPKMLGGIYGIANNRGVKTLDELKGICAEVSKAGHVPSVHGDAGGMLGCGFCKLWLQGKFEDLGCAAPNFTAEEGGDAVKAAGGVVEMHYGAHAEKVVYINLVPDKTLEPDHDDQRFIVDAWAAGKFNLDVPKYLVTAAATVERLGGPKKAVLVVPDPPPLTPEDIVGVLEGRGWEAKIVTAGKVPDLIDVDPKGILKCVDGRGSDNKKMAGPKMLGGIYGIANNRGVKTLDELKGICAEVSKAGHVPSVHGDAGGMLGCGFCKLWLQGKFEDLGCAAPNFTAEEGGDAVKAAGGVVEMHYGAHAEKVVYINLVPDKTLEPDHDDQRFIVDAWAAGKFNLDVPKYLVTAAATVERLGGPKKAVLIVPSPKQGGAEFKMTIAARAVALGGLLILLVKTLGSTFTR